MMNTKAYKSYNIINFSNITKYIAVFLGFICYVMTTNAHASTKVKAKAANKGAHDCNCYKGLKFGVQGDDPYWLSLSGGLKLDQRLFLGRKHQHELHSGASLKELSLAFSGGMGKNVSVAIGLGFRPANSSVEIEDAYVTYSGFKHFGENFQVSIGKVNSSFCLETHSSGKWIPFLERSSVSTAFKADPGLGVSVNKWQKDYSINGTITMPKPNNVITNDKGETVKRSDRLQYNARLTKAYFFNTNKLIQAGVFGHFKDDGRSGIEFSSPIEATARYSTSHLLNTTATTPAKKLIKSKNHYTVGLELLAQNGPLSGEIEYLSTKVHRDKEQAGGNLKFKGYRSNINYVLTGESRAFKNSNGTLGQVIPNQEGGAWEISGRYDYINLNDKDVLGGSAHHIGFATTWYINYNFSVTGEYIRSNVNKSMTLEKLKVNTLGARLQLVF